LSVNISCREIVGLGVCIRAPQLNTLRDIANKVRSQQIVAMNIPEVQEEVVEVEEVSAVIKTDLAPFQATIDLVAAAATVRS
jgi:archaellum component FlaC